MPVELTIVESVTELDTTVVEVVLESASAPGPAGPGVAAGGTVGQVLTKQSGTDFDTDWEDPTGGGGGSGEATVIEYTQAAHGFDVGDVLRFDGADWVLAQADTSENAEVYGIVSEDIDANTFALTTHGKVEGLTGLTAGEVHFLDPSTPGALTDTAPSSGGDVSKPFLLAVSTTEGVVVNMRGIVIPGVGGGGGESALDWQDVSAGVGFTNGAANFGGGYRNCAYAKDDAKGLLYFRGIANPGSSGAIFTLPSGYRPSTNAITTAFADAAAAPLEIQADGVVNAFLNPSTSLSLEGVVISL